MKHSNTWFALILIASALLLSAANVARAAKNPKSPAAQNSQEASAQQQESQAKETPAPTAESSISAPPAQPSPTVQSSDTSTNPQSWNDWFWQNFAALLLAVLAIWAGLIGLRTLDAIREQAQIARDGIGKLERPWIFVQLEKLEFIANKGGDYVICVYIRRRNVGRSPAWTFGGRIATKKVTDFEKLPRLPDYFAEGTMSLPAPVAQSEELSIHEERLFLNEAEWVDFAKGKLTPTVLGEINYRDNLSPDDHTTRYCICLVHPMKDPFPNAPVIVTSPVWFFGGPKEYNLFT
jgi:hypothetical protein